MFRNASPEHFLEKYPLEKGFGVRRAMVFNRYPILTSLFTELGLQIPKSFLEPLDRAGKLYRKDTGKVKLNPQVPLVKPQNLSSLPKLSVPAEEPYPEYASGTPLATTPVFGTTPAGTPPGATPPLTPKGGTRRQKRLRGTRKNNKNAASLFTRIWKIHGSK
jgi:hypothetical protein